MPRPALFRRRRVWVPTIWAFLLVILAAAAKTLFLILSLHPFLSPHRPVGNAPLLVVEGWMSARQLDQAIDAYKSGGYERIVTTGGPIYDVFERVEASATYAERARRYLVQHGLPDDKVIAVPAPASNQDRSFLNAVVIRNWALQQNPPVEAFDVYSSGVHTRRSWDLYRMAFDPGVRIGILGARPSYYDPAEWWTTSVGVKEVIPEAIAWAWTKLFFHPGPAGTHDEMWGEPPITPPS
jgi:hypothetical protein